MTDPALLAAEYHPKMAELIQEMDDYLHGNGTLPGGSHWHLHLDNIVVQKDLRQDLADCQLITTIRGATRDEKLAWLKGFRAAIDVFLMTPADFQDGYRMG